MAKRVGAFGTCHLGVHGETVFEQHALHDHESATDYSVRGGASDDYQPSFGQG
jgi:hypothetical protein